jgi:tRNA-dihydrouridine synthase
VKESLKIPVIASGDALTPYLVKKLLDDSGCNGIVIARGALGNPWIFRETVEYMEGGTRSFSPDVYEITQTMKEHLSLNIAFYGEKSGVMQFRKFFGWYSRGMAAKELKGRAFRAGTRDEMLELIKELSECSSIDMSSPVEKLGGINDTITINKGGSQ